MIEKFFIFVILLICCEITSGLYEDQIGKFDWKKEFVGSIKYSVFENNHNTAFVSTEQNVVASLSLKDGEIIWRHVLEKGDLGMNNLLYLYKNLLFTVNGVDVIIVRGWNIKNGILNYQWSVEQQFHEFNNTDRILWFAHDVWLNKVVLKSSDEIELSVYKIFNGEKISTRIINLPPSVISSDDECAISNSLLFCVNDFGYYALVNLTDESDGAVSYPIKLELDATNAQHSVKALPNVKNPTFVVSNGTMKILLVIYSFNNIEVLSSTTDRGDLYTELVTLDSSLVVIEANPVTDRTLEINEVLLVAKQSIYSHQFSLKYPIGKVIISNAYCAKQTSGQISCSLLLTTSDGSLIYLKAPGEIKWVREETLAGIITAEMIELPMSDMEAEMQKEFDAKESDIFNMFTRRILSHIFQLQKIIFGISGLLEKSFTTKSTSDSKLIRDYFNLHKIILVITKHMKVYAIDNISKDILWSYLLNDDFEPFPAPSTTFDVRIPMFIQRTYRHYPHPMLCTILIRDRKNKNGVIISFNPVTGVFEIPIKLDYKIKQVMLIPKQTSNDYLQGIMLLDDNNRVHVYPERTKSVLLEFAFNMYIHVAEAETCEINGYTFSSDVSMTLVPVWNFKCSGRIIEISGKNPIEKVHSQGRVLADRSVLYKYINPNLIAVVSQEINPEDQKSMLTLYFVDSVTGNIINGDVRHRASHPVHLVHSENWIVLMYINDKAKRTEVVTYELYEGKTQRNSTAFSSIQAKSLRPIIDSRAYILPTSYVEAAEETITEKGITSKHVLVALSSGTVVELPWVFLDPRRPFTSTNEIKEEGILPYMPEIPIATETMINYNQTLNRVRGILTSPSGLESTCLVFVYGLDLFYTRTAPSKTFDLLKEDFDYMLIVIVLALLLVLTFITKHFAYRRALRQAWR